MVQVQYLTAILQPQRLPDILQPISAYEKAYAEIPYEGA